MNNLGWIFASLVCIIIPFLMFYGFKMQGKKFKTVLGVNIFSFFAVMVTMVATLWSGVSFAEGEALTIAEQAAINAANGMAFLAASLSTGLACVGAGIAVAAAASAALGAISEDSGIMGRTLIFVALAEGIALYGLVISIMILGKI